MRCDRVLREGPQQLISCARNSEGDTSKTINSEYQVDPERNGGAAFPHKEVVRNKAERQRMHAFDCACCSDVSPYLSRSCTLHAHACQ